jgi:epsilon-lactone hydrolase
MPSQAMQELIDALRDQQKAGASHAPPTLEERRVAFAPAGRLHPVPDDVLVTEVTAGGVPAHWLAAPGADTGRVLLFLHGGGYELGSLRSDGELAARLGRASGMRVLFPEYRLAPEHPFPAAIDDVLAAWHWLRSRPPPCSVSSPPTIWPELTPRRPWRRRCSPHWPGFRRC